MVFENLDWAIPEDPKLGVNLNVHELLLLDWTLCPSSGIIPGADIDTLIQSWHELRQSIWGHFYQASMSDLSQRYFVLLDHAEAKYLLTVTPTTFRWGTGPDCGFSLKRRLYLFLQGITPPEDLPKEEPPNA